MSYSRDVQPILSDHCFTCHGPDEKSRKAKLRLDLRAEAIRDSIVPGNSKASELIYRTHTDDENDIMPPPEFKKPLTDAEKEILERWVNEGAEYEDHWAFLAPKKAEPPAGDAKNPVDRFLDAKLAEKRLNPSPKTNHATLLRRLHLDLTGIAPTPEEIAAFDGNVDAAITRLFASTRYGEHLAREWLDVARYADSSGYQYDKERTMWPWRDWVVEAFSSNMPFDQFTIEQLAGDLFEEPTEKQRLATGFNRNHPITIEGGVIDEEYRVEYVMDRVSTVGTAWMGLTLGCARCHDHKYDPISQKEFYELFAFFNQVPERGQNGFNPQMAVVPDFKKGALEEIDEEIQQLRNSLEVRPEDVVAWRESLKPGEWKNGDFVTAITVPPGAPDELTLTAVPDETKRIDGQFVRISRTGKDIYLQISELEVMSGGENVARAGKASQSTTGYGGLPAYAIDGNRSGVYADKTISHTLLQADPWLEVDLGAEKTIETIGLWGRQDCCPERLDEFRVEVLDKDRKVVFTLENNPAPTDDAGRVLEVTGAVSQVFLRKEGLNENVRVAKVALPKEEGFRIEVEGDLKVESATADPAWTQLAGLPKDVLQQLQNPDSDLTDAYRKWSPAAQQLLAEVAALEAHRKAVFEQSSVNVMVMQDMPNPRETFILDRGLYSERRDKVEMGVPEVLPAFGDLPKNRLGFAQWLVQPDHPLTARVIVNRVWQRIFGIGLVKSAEDFGIQAEWPSHPELLDWLAVEFVENNWDLQHLQRLILSSNAYARSSDYRADLAEADPENRLLARAPRMRMTAEEIRDNTLHAAGVLRDQIGGPPVYPYQPKGLWLEVNNRRGYSRPYPEPTEADLFRRSLYTFAKRTVPHPSLQTFDSPNREFCTVSRSRTNTPLQALALMHSPEYVEAARHLGALLLNIEGDDETRLRAGFERVTSRAPQPDELAILTQTLADETARFTADPAAAETLLAVGISGRDEKLDPITHAAMTSVARLLLNLDEAINKN
ncbi:MAG: DUF1553 domain-containing protein [Verrucomicrobiota bacterium]